MVLASGLCCCLGCASVCVVALVTFEVADAEGCFFIVVVVLVADLVMVILQLFKGVVVVLVAEVRCVALIECASGNFAVAKHVHLFGGPYFEHHVLNGVGDVFSCVGKVKTGLVVRVHVSATFGELVSFGVAVDVGLLAASFYIVLLFLSRGVSFLFVIKVGWYPPEDEQGVVGLSDVVYLVEYIGVFVRGIVPVPIKDSLHGGDGAFAIGVDANSGARVCDSMCYSAELRPENGLLGGLEWLVYVGRVTFRDI